MRVGRVLGVVASCLLALAGCGGSDTASAPSVVPSLSNGVTIEPGSEIAAVLLGDELQRIAVLPGDLTQRAVRIHRTTETATFDLAVTEGNEFISVTRDAAQLAVLVDSRRLSPSEKRRFSLTVRNTSSGTSAIVRGEIIVLEPRTIGSGQINQLGGSVFDAAGNAILEIDPQFGAQPLGVEVISAPLPNGGTRYHIRFDRDVSADTRRMRLVPPRSVATPRNGATPQSAPDGLARPTVLWANGAENLGAFTTDGDFRFDYENVSPSVLQAAGFAICGLGNSGCVDWLEAWQLDGSVAEGSKQWGQTEPILFVHGYNLAVFGLGGGSETWGRFRELARGLPKTGIAALATDVEAFEFQWRTNAKFELVAKDLESAIVKINGLTNRRVTIVAHSFGGVLVRTMLQGIGRQDRRDWSKVVRQVITLGTPHSGLHNSEIVTTFSKEVFPDGQDGIEIGNCDQTPCHQMGESVFFPRSSLLPLIGVDAQPGELAASLADLAANPLPAGVPLAVAIGLDIDERAFRDDVYRPGDSLITFAGQRFEPALAGAASIGFLNCESRGLSLVRELTLGNNRRPGDVVGIPLNDETRGYAHTNFQSMRDRTNENAEAYVESEAHKSFELLRQSLRDGICYPRIVDAPLPQFAASGASPTFRVTGDGPGTLRFTWLVDGTPLTVDAAGRFTTPCNGGSVTSDTTGSTLTFTNVQSSCANTSVAATVSNQAGERTSGVTTLLVTTAPPLVLPDLIVESVSFNPVSVALGGQVQVNFTIVNQGDGVASASPAVVRMNQSSTPPGAEDLASVMVPSLAPGARATFSSVAVSAPAVAGGYRVWVTADADGSAGQSAANRGNDSASALGTLTVTSLVGPALPDIAVQSVAFSPTSAVPGASVRIDFTISNVGSAMASLSTAAIRISPSAVSPGTATLASVAVPSIPSGSTVGLAASVAAPLAAGTYYVWVLADVGGTSGQPASATGNDVLRATSPLSVGVTLTPPQITVQPSSVTVTEGAKATFSISATGSGLSYQWRKNGANVVCASGAECPSYTTPATTVNDDGAIYSVAISNSGGTAESANAVLTVVPASTALDFRRVSAGWYFSLAVKSDGTLWGTGDSFYGQLGIAGLPFSNAEYWTQVPGMSKVVGVETGSSHSLAVTLDGNLWVTGWNGWGQLGLGDTTDRSTWTHVGVLSNVKAIAAGPNHSLALLHDGSIWGTGDGTYGQLGANAANQLSNWTKVPESSGYVAIAAGVGHSLALKGDGTVWVTGLNGSGQLGTGGDLNTYVVQWTQTPGLANVISIAAGSMHSLAITSDGSMWVTGNNRLGQLGLGDTADRAVWTRSNLTSVVAVSAGENYSFALKADGTLWATGLMIGLGIGINVDNAGINDWRQIAIPTGIKALAGGLDHSVALMKDGSVWGTGSTPSIGLGWLTNGLPYEELNWRQAQSQSGF